MMSLYVVHWIVFAGLFALSWLRSGRILHPHFMFTCMLFVLYSDFLVRGNDDYNLVGMLPEVLAGYQVATLFATASIIILAAFIRKPYEQVFFRKLAGRNIGIPAFRMLGAEPKMGYVLAGAVFILFIETIKRLYATGFSPGEVFFQMLGPRGYRDWDVDGGSADNAFFQLVRAILPFSAISLSYLIVAGKRAIQMAAILAFFIVMFILVTDGSRTPVVMALASLTLFQFVLRSGRFGKALTLALAGAAMAFLSSLMYQFRSAGLGLDAAVDEAFVYHQDDSIYRAWYSYSIADGGHHFWNPIEFYYTVLTLPIPRALWSGKPLFDAAFYGEYKLSYVTSTFFGESVAMFGVFWGTMWAVLTSLVIYRGLYSAQRLLSYTFGLAPYLVIALYTYMCLRSTQNITQFMFLPVASVVAVVILNRLGARSSPPGAPRTLKLMPPGNNRP